MASDRDKLGKRVVEDVEIVVFLPGTALQVNEVLQEVISRFRENTLRVVLNRFEGILAVTNSHDHTTFLGGSGDRELRRKSLDSGTQGMVTSGLDSLGYALENTASVVTDSTNFSVHNFACIAREDIQHRYRKIDDTDKFETGNLPRPQRR